MINRITSAYQRMADRRRLFGLKGALGIREFEKARRRGEAVENSLIEIRPPGSLKPLWMRWESSDPWVAEQVYVKKEYGLLDAMSNVRTIVDCGANVGYTSAYFLDHHPNSRLLAVEPMDANAEVCKRNLRSYGERADVLRAAVWDSCDSLEVFCPGGPEERRAEWAMRVRAPNEDAPALVPSVPIPDLIERVGGFVDILKIDIEGAEERVFAGPAPWLDAVRTVAIEVHGENCRRVVSKAFEDKHFQTVYSGELTLFCNSAFRQELSLEKMHAPNEPVS